MRTSSIGTAARPGPAPMSAQQARAVNEQNSRTKKAAQQTAQRTASVVQQLSKIPYREYDPRRQIGWQMTADSSGPTRWERKQVRELWVFSRVIDRWGSREFVVYNPNNQTYVEFIPAGYFAASSQIRNIASATGEFGKHFQSTLATISITAITGGLAGAAGLAGAGVRAVVGRIAIDGAIQFSGGLIAHDLRFKDAIEEINFTSAFLAGLPGSSMWGSLRNNIIGATAELKLNYEAGRIKMEFADLQTISGVINYMQKVSIGVSTDYFTGKVSARLAPVRGANAAGVTRATKAGDMSKRWLYEHNVKLLSLLDVAIERSTKAIGEGASNIFEDALKSEKPSPTQVAPRKTR